MDYAIDTVKAMDGAPEHSEEEKSGVLGKLSKLNGYLKEMEQSYLDNTPGEDLPQLVREHCPGRTQLRHQPEILYY